MATAVQTNKTFQFELVSPEKVLFSEQVKMVTVPGEAGEFGVLANHAPLLSSMLPGVVTVTTAEDEIRKVYVSGGFADVSDNVCAVLAEEAVNVEDIDRLAVQEKVEVLKTAVAEAKNKGDALEASSLTKKLIVAQDMLSLAA